MSIHLPDLLHLLQRAEYLPSDIRFFLIDPTRIIRCVGGTLSIRTYPQELGFIHQLELHRGPILEVFATLEGFINEFLHLHFFGLSYSSSEQFDELLEYIDFSRRVQVLF